MLTVPCVLQFDFTSCQGVLFVLLMTLFFSGLLLAILLPFQYVSLSLLVCEGGGDDPMLRVHALLTPAGHPRAKASWPDTPSSPPGT